MAGEPFPKPASRSRLKGKAYLDLSRRNLLANRVCQCCNAKPSASSHHIYPRGQGGDDVIENLAALCGDGVKGCHGMIERNDPGARADLGRNLRPEQIAYVHDKLGERAADWLQRRYHR